MFPQLFQVVKNVHNCFYNSIEMQQFFFYFFWKIVFKKKGKLLGYVNYQSVNSLRSHHHYMLDLCVY